MNENEVDRVASASLNLYSTLEAAFREFRTEIRNDLRAVQESTRDMSTILSEMRGANVTSKIEDHEARLRLVEKFKDNISGRMIIISAIAIPLTGLLSAIASGIVIKVLMR